MILRMNLVVAVFVAASSTSPLLAATRVWTGAPATPPLWSNPANWGGVAPVAGDDLVFPTGTAFGTVTNDFPAGTTFNSISVSAPFLTLAGNAIGLGAGGWTSTATNVVFIETPLTLTASQAWSSSFPTFVQAPTAISGNTLTFNGPHHVFFWDGVSGSGSLVAAGGGLNFSGPNTFSGTVTVTGGYVSLFHATMTAPVLQTAGGFSFSMNSTAGTLDIRGGSFGPGQGSNGPDATVVNSGNIILAAGVTYFEAVRTTDPSSGFANLHVTGSVSLGGATLIVFNETSSGFAPGDQLTFIVNDGTDPVVGTFAGLPEGAIVSGSGESRQYRISYVAGTGNDVVLTVVGPSTTTLTSAPNPSVHTQNVTFTATIGGATGGTVTFNEGATVLGTVSVGAGGVATLTTGTLSVGSHLITATFGGSGALLPSTSNVVTQLVNEATPMIPTSSWWSLAALALALAVAGVLVRH